MARFLALDWDHQQLHVVSATVSGGGVRIQRAVVWQEQQSPNPIEAENLGQILREHLKSAGIAAAPVLACIGRDRVILKEVRFPSVPASEEAAIIRFQAVKELTDPPEEVIIDYNKVGEPGTAGEQRAMALVVRREMLLAYQTLCKAAGLKLQALTPRAYGVAACVKRLVGTTVLTPAPDPPDAAVAVLTCSEKWAEFCVVKGDNLLYSRSLAGGPGLAGEVRRNLAVYQGQSPQQPVRALYVAGGSEHVAIRDRLKEMGIAVHPLDPFAGVESPDLPANSRGAFAGAVGLLQAQADKRALPINFVQPKEPKPPRDPNQRRLAIAAAVAAVLLLGGVSLGYAKMAQKSRLQDALFLERKTLDQHLLLLEEDAKRIKALDDWANAGVIWLDEIYDLTDRFPSIVDLRLTQMVGSPLPRSLKEKYAAKMTLEGITTDQGVQSVDALISRMVADGHYRPDAKNVKQNTSLDRFRFPRQFSTRVDIEKVPPAKFVRQMPPPPEEEPEPGRGRGRGQRGGGEAGFGFPGGELP